MLLGFIVVLAGCGGSSDSVCTSACNKMHGCGLDKIHITAVNAYEPCTAAPECDPITTCVSNCFMQASCGDLQQVAIGGAFHSCLVACNSWFQVAP